MSVEKQLFTRLSGYAGLTALVGSSSNCRIYPGVLPQNVTFPAISFRRVAAQRISAMGDDTGTVRAVFQFDVWGNEYRDIRPVAEQLRQALQRYRVAGLDATIQDVFLQNEFDMFEADSPKPHLGLHHCVMDFEVIYQEN